MIVTVRVRHAQGSEPDDGWVRIEDPEHGIAHDVRPEPSCWRCHGTGTCAYTVRMTGVILGRIRPCACVIGAYHAHLRRHGEGPEAWATAERLREYLTQIEIDGAPPSRRRRVHEVLAAYIERRFTDYQRSRWYGLGLPSEPAEQ